MTNIEYANALRRIADFYEATPDAYQTGDLFGFIYGREEFLKAAKALAHGGKVSKYADDPGKTLAYFHADRDFGGLKIKLHIDRKDVCRLISPAVYDCPDSLIEAAREYENA